MGTVNRFDELAKPGSNLSAALAKPSSVDPKGQADAYSRDKLGWQKSEAKELMPTADNVADFFTKPLMGKHFFLMRK